MSIIKAIRESKNKRIMLNVEKSTYDLIHSNAREKGISLSAYVRQILMNERKIESYITRKQFNKGMADLMKHISQYE